MNKKSSNIGRLDRNMAIKTVDENGLRWHQPYSKPFKLVGFNWFKEDHVYRRIPLKNTGVLSEGVESLSWHTAGGQVKFRSNASKISLKVKLRDSILMDHMPQTGSNGFDLYIGEPGNEKFGGVSRFEVGKIEYKSELFDCCDGKMRNFTINFPLYKGVDEVLIGLPADAELLPSPAFVSESPLVVYGTSITQGGCAARPGSCYSNILSRHLNRPFINLGFSGNGKGEPELAQIISSIKKPAMIILDYQANAGVTLQDTLPVFIKILRQHHRDVPILVVSCIKFGFIDFVCDDPKIVSKQKMLRDSLRFQQQLVRKLRTDGDDNIYFLNGGTLLGSDYEECTVDLVHPTDLGFYRMANKIETKIKSILV